MIRLSALVLALFLAGCAPRVIDVPYPVVPVELPRDDAAHIAPIEWWYWVGHLQTDDGRRFGFQLTFFEAYVPPVYRVAGVLPLRYLIEKGFVAHAAVVDLDAERHVMGQRSDDVYRADASYDDLDVFVGGWRASRAEDGVAHALTFDVGGYALDLVVNPTKPASLHGDTPGILSMGPGGVSYYVSHTRMEVSGSLRGPCRLPRACPATAVQGQAWFDHQWGDFRIDRFGGWDWFALQFDDGADLMLYLIRGEDGALTSAEGSYVTADGRTLPLTEDAFELEPTGAAWTSPETGATYPAGWRIRVPAHGVDVLLVPLVSDQEMDTRATTRIVYWEGAVDVRGERPGVGFVELTNYDRVPIAATRP
jgi:predicted secreted hydrolase